MVFADTHAHLYLDEFDADRPEVIRRAAEAGVRYLMLPNIDSTSVEGMLEMRRQFPGICHPMMGLHPTSVKANYREELEAVSGQFLKDPNLFCAIGEIGIDLYWDKTYAEAQDEVFRFQLNLAGEYGLPVVIHTRNSFDHTIEIIEKEGRPGLKGVFHCFGGNLAQAERAIALGFKLGIGGVITYRNSGQQEVVEATGLEHLLLETDAPFLPPVPYRGQRNESRYIPVIAKKIAEIKGCRVEQVAEVTTENALSLFIIQS